MEITDHRLTEMLDLCHAEVPDFEVRFKDKSKLMAFLNFFVQLFNKRFMTTFTTVIGSKVYFPSEQYLREKPASCAHILAHELQHMKDAQRMGTFLFVLSYFMPQILAPLALLSLLAFWHLGFLAFLIFLVFLAPIPAWGRKEIEMRGYVMSLAVTYWATGHLMDEDFEHTVQQFTSPSYYFMWPFRDRVMHELKLNAIAIRSGSICRDPLFAKVRTIFLSDLAR